MWEFRYYETNPEGKRVRRSMILGEQALYRTEANARKATQAILMQLNEEVPRAEMEAPTFGALLDKYIEHELPERHSRSSHLSNIRKHIRRRWNEQPVNKMKPMAMARLQHYSKDGDRVFANPQTGKPYHQESLKNRPLRRVADIIGLPEGIGWHTFRHTYRSWLDETGAPMKVQQELMRHASIQTTMNVYGRAMTDSKRKANSQVVGLAFGESLGTRREASSTTALQ